MAQFVDLGGLWKPKPGAKVALSGSVNIDSLQEVVELSGREKSVRCFVKKNDRKTGNQPDYRIVAVIQEAGDESYDRGQDRDRGVDSGRDRDRDRPSDRGRSYRNDEPRRDNRKQDVQEDEEVPF